MKEEFPLTNTKNKKSKKTKFKKKSWSPNPSMRNSERNLKKNGMTNMKFTKNGFNPMAIKTD